MCCFDMLLINLKELHLEFKKATDIKIKFSKFCEHISENISGISFIYVSAKDVERHSVLIGLEKRYESA